MDQAVINKLIEQLNKAKTNQELVDMTEEFLNDKYLSYTEDKKAAMADNVC